MGASTSRRRSGSPGPRPAHTFTAPNIGPTKGSSKRSSQPPVPHNKSSLTHKYVSSSMQTDGDEHGDSLESGTFHHHMRTPYVSLTKRLLLRCQKERERLEAAKNAAQNPPNEVSHNLQRSSSAEGNEPPVLDPVDVTPIGKAPESERNDVKHDQRQEPGSLSSNIPVQKPRPPDQTSILFNPTSTAEIKPPPPPWSSQLTPASSVHRRPTNGHHSNDLRVQLPPAPQLSREPAYDSVVLTPTSSVVRSPFTQTLNTHPSTLPTGPSNLVHPSPVKKVSLEDYINRNRLSNSKAESQSISDKNASASPVLQQTPPKASAAIEGESKPIATEGAAIVDTPMKEAYDTPVDGKGLKL